MNCIVQAGEKATKQMSTRQKLAWVWDGHIPSNYKTACRKSLEGWWVNYQHSVKAKGVLKCDREVILSNTALKWNVLTKKSMKDMNMLGSWN